MSLINVANLTFAYPGSYDNIFENAGFQLDTDWKLGFTGRNGRGKTTFLHLLCGRYEYSGTISAGVGFEYFPFEIADKQQTVEAVVASLCAEYEQWQLLRELSLLEMGEDMLNRAFDTLSGGEQTKVLLAALFLKENAFLLIDEPTNHLDMHGRRVLAEYLNRKKGYILVSHDRAFLDGCIDHVLSINRANIEVQRGNFSSWLANKERQDQFELAENAKLKKEIKRLEKTAREKAQWSDKAEATKMGKGAATLRKKGHVGADTMAYNAEKSRRMQQQRKNIETRQQNALADKSKLLKNLDKADALKLSPLPYHTTRMMELRDVIIQYGEVPVNAPLSFTLERGERIALLGRNGCGKSSIIKLLCGIDVPHRGEVNIGSRLQISYVSQETSHLAGNLSDYARKNNIDESLFKAILRKLDFSRIQFDKDMRDFSGGQKKKCLIARSLCENVHVLVWDEPLNFIDVLSRMQIEELLLAYTPTLLFVEHDHVFCDKIATKKIHI